MGQIVRKWHKNPLRPRELWALLTRVYTSSCRLKPLKMAVKWASASGDPPADCWSCVLYFLQCQVSGHHDNADSNLPLCQVRPWPKHLKRNLSEVNKIAVLIGHCTCATGKIVHAASAHSGTVPLRADTSAHSDTVPLDWRKLTSIWVAQTAVPPE